MRSVGPDGGMDLDDSFDTEETLSVTVVTAVAEATGQSPLEMDPLWESIDPDALASLLDDTARSASSPTVTFTYCGCRVTVTPDDIQVGQPN